MAKTEKNLGEAYTGESQARSRYNAFAERAEADGLTEIAKLFRETADQEYLHAKDHLHRLGIVKSTEENLDFAIKGEEFEYKEMYPRMIKDARAEGDEWALTILDIAMEAEKRHAARFRKALEDLRRSPK